MVSQKLLRSFNVHSKQHKKRFKACGTKFERWPIVIKTAVLMKKQWLSTIPIKNFNWIITQKLSSGTLNIEVYKKNIYSIFFVNVNNCQHNYRCRYSFVSLCSLQILKIVRCISDLNFIWTSVFIFGDIFLRNILPIIILISQKRKKCFISPVWIYVCTIQRLTLYTPKSVLKDKLLKPLCMRDLHLLQFLRLIHKLRTRLFSQQS